MGSARNESTETVRARVLAARAAAAARGVRTNAAIPVQRLDALAPLTAEAEDVLAQALTTGRLSARGLHRVRRVARTIADLQDSPQALTAAHVATALSLRADAAPNPSPRVLTA